MRVKQNNAVIDTLNFPLCNAENGMQEEWIPNDHTPDIISTNILNRTITTIEILGQWKALFTLNYARWSEKMVGLLMKKYFDYRVPSPGQSHPILFELTPRSDVDVPQRTFPVVYIGQSLTIGIRRGGLKAKGNTGIALPFKTINSYSQPQIYDPDMILYGGEAEESPMAGQIIT